MWQVLAAPALQTSSFDSNAKAPTTFKSGASLLCPSPSLTILQHVPPTNIAAAILATLKKPPHSYCSMSSRVSTGARPGARFAQFKLVLLGSCILPLAGIPIKLTMMQESLQ